MGKSYDIWLFIDIIETYPGIKFLRDNELDGIKVRFYQGLSGNLVMIDTTDEEISNNTGKGYLLELGLSHMISALFP